MDERHESHQHKSGAATIHHDHCGLGEHDLIGPYRYHKHHSIRWCDEAEWREGGSEHIAYLKGEDGMYDRDRHIFDEQEEELSKKPTIPVHLRGVEDVATDAKRRVFVSLEVDPMFADWVAAHRGQQLELGEINIGPTDLGKIKTGDLAFELYHRTKNE